MLEKNCLETNIQTPSKVTMYLGCHNISLVTTPLQFQSHQRVLDVRRKLFGEEHARTADSYREVGMTQYMLGDYSSALQSHQRALDVRRKLFGEEHADLADSYLALGFAQNQLGDYSSALQSLQHALDEVKKLFGEEHANTAACYRDLVNNLGDFHSERQSHLCGGCLQCTLF